MNEISSLFNEISDITLDSSFFQMKTFMISCIVAPRFIGNNN